MKNKCAVETCDHSECSNIGVCYADPAGIVHDTVIKTPCPNDAVEGSRYCIVHYERFEGK